MGHIHTEAGQIDQTVTAYVLRRDGDEVYIMLHQHKKLHKLLPVGGHVELDETPWQAMAHELVEESGYALEELAVMQPTPRIEQLDKVVLHPQPLVVQTHSISEEHMHTDQAYLFMAETMPSGVVQDDESQGIRWLTRDGVERLREDEIYENTRQICLAVFDSFVASWKAVPTREFATTTSSM